MRGPSAECGERWQRSKERLIAFNLSSRCCRPQKRLKKRENGRDGESSGKKFYDATFLFGGLSLLFTIRCSRKAEEKNGEFSIFSSHHKRLVVGKDVLFYAGISHFFG